MSNALTTNKNTVLDEYLASSGLPLLFYKQGRYLDAAKAEVPAGTRYIADIPSHQHGWMRWEDNKPVEPWMGRLHGGFRPPAREDLGFLDESLWPLGPNGQPTDPIQRSESMVFFGADGAEVLFTTGSWGGHTGLAALERAYARDGSRRNPLIALDSVREANSHGGLTDKPRFQVLGWVELQRDRRDGCAA